MRRQAATMVMSACLTMSVAGWRTAIPVSGVRLVSTFGDGACGTSCMGCAGANLVEDGYELYWNGVLLGGSGRLGASPRVVGTHPLIFALPADATGTTGVLAIRTFMQPGNDAAADSGGIHVAPTLAPRPESRELYHVQ